jgi:hypothetical protein
MEEQYPRQDGEVSTAAGSVKLPAMPMPSNVTEHQGQPWK